MAGAGTVVKSDIERLGWFLTDEGISQCIDMCTQHDLKPTAKNITTQSLNLDIRSIGAKALPESLLRSRTSELKKTVILQVQKIRNVAVESKRQHSDQCHKRLLRLQLTDGHLHCSAIESSGTIQGLKPSTPAGTKLKIISSVSVVNGFLLLTPKNVQFLGGHVEHMAKKWNLQKYSLGKLVEGGSTGFIKKIKQSTPLSVQSLQTIIYNGVPDNLHRNKIVDEQGYPRFIPYTQNEAKSKSGIKESKTIELNARPVVSGRPIKPKTGVPERLEDTKAIEEKSKHEKLKDVKITEVKSKPGGTTIDLTTVTKQDKRSKQPQEIEERKVPFKNRSDHVIQHSTDSYSERRIDRKSEPVREHSNTSKKEALVKEKDERTSRRDQEKIIVHVHDPPQQRHYHDYRQRNYYEDEKLSAHDRMKQDDIRSMDEAYSRPSHSVDGKNSSKQKPYQTRMDGYYDHDSRYQYPQSSHYSQSHYSVQRNKSDQSRYHSDGYQDSQHYNRSSRFDSSKHHSDSQHDDRSSRFDSSKRHSDSQHYDRSSRFDSSKRHSDSQHDDRSSRFDSSKRHSDSQHDDRSSRFDSSKRHSDSQHDSSKHYSDSQRYGKSSTVDPSKHQSESYDRSSRSDSSKHHSDTHHYDRSSQSDPSKHYSESYDKSSRSDHHSDVRQTQHYSNERHYTKPNHVSEQTQRKYGRNDEYQSTVLQKERNDVRMQSQSDSKYDWGSVTSSSTAPFTAKLSKKT